MDALSAALKPVRLEGALFFHGEFSDPWSFRSPESAALAPVLAPGARHVLIYHLVTEGTGCVELEGGTPVDLIPGDIVMLPHGDAHWMWSGSRTNPLNLQVDWKQILANGLGVARMGGGGETTRFVCGFLSCDQQICRIMLRGVPRLIKVNIRGDEAGRWLEESIRFLAGGAPKPGSEAVTAKVSEALFAETLRRYMEQAPAASLGWLAACQDAEVGKALALLHEKPGHPWTLAELAQASGVSRSVLAARFQQLLNEGPMGYLTRWRMHLAAHRLENSRAIVAEIGYELGYESEASFNRAFKRMFGVPPARYRKGAAARSGSG